MTTLREVFVAALKSLLRGKTFIQALLAFWVNPSILKGSKSEPISHGSEDSSRPRRSIQDFLREAEELFLQPIRGDGLKDFSLKLKAQFKEGLLSDPSCMLPSYNHQLPSRSEHGRFLALDVGGSTLRVALVELRGHEAQGSESRIVRQETFKIDRAIKNLEGKAFFDWMAQRIVDTVSKDLDSGKSPEKPLLMGLAWSFPIEQTSLKGGKLQGMGKGFLAANGLLGQDLGDIIKAACQTKSLHVELAAIVNDSAAALLSEAYLNSSTRFGLILGTGVNIAVHLPVPTIGRDKFGNRPSTWFDKASHVIVNTELGMFGKGILPRTRWDKVLNAAHPKPDFQPLEHLVSGFYLGEMCRLALVEAIDTTGLLGGVVPPSLLLPYSLDTETISLIEADTSSSQEPSLTTFKSRHPSPIEPTTADIAFIRTLASYISRRSSAIVAASIFALWQFKNEAEADYLVSSSSSSTPSLDSPAHFLTAAQGELDLQGHVVAFNGSVIEQYPGYLQNCQDYLDELVSSAGGAKPATISLVGAKESSLLGAAVALACLEEGKAN
ncbi:Hexokinase-1 [Cytospora mali]|uniref:Phosphotransferase n=1 Tax=Cytospora mali TaxID=578113 RepID=A0A194V555_CYTMA|nr:Hexokinase-1 [Valsa mali var. pyri (nom. inval.)]